MGCRGFVQRTESAQRFAQVVERHGVVRSDRQPLPERRHRRLMGAFGGQGQAEAAQQHRVFGGAGQELADRRRDPGPIAAATEFHGLIAQRGKLSGRQRRRRRGGLGRTHGKGRGPALQPLRQDGDGVRMARAAGDGQQQRQNPGVADAGNHPPRQDDPGQPARQQTGLRCRVPGQCRGDRRARRYRH